MTCFTGVILSGGQGKRVNGQDKGLIILRYNPLYKYVLNRLRPQVNFVLISANRNINQYQESGYKIINDLIPNYLGPLGGILSGLYYSQTEWVTFCPCDMLWIPSNYVAKLWQEIGNAPAVWVKSSKQHYPTLSLINQKLFHVLRKFLLNNERCLIDFLSKNGGHSITLNEEHALSFQNINTLNDLTHASILMESIIDNNKQK